MYCLPALLHLRGKARTVIPLDSARGSESMSTRLRHQLVLSGRPLWAPFPSRADFEWVETTYMMPEANIEAQLKGHHSNWCDRSYLNIKTVDNLKMYLERAKHYVVEEWLLNLVSDPTLVDEIAWYPSRKYLVIDGVRQRLRDEAYNSDKLWEMQSTLPVVPGLPHCLLPMLGWLDKGRVSSHTNMHPMILCLLFLRSKICNASGNGGGELAGFVRDRKDPADRSQAEKIAFAKFKRDVYHRVLQTVFVDTLREKADGGKCVPCADSVQRVLFPHIPVLLLNGEEACTCAATQGALADFPCPRCLVRHDQLHDFFSPNLEFPFGKHLWPLLMDVLATLGFKGMIRANMAKVPRWPDLKHFDNVTTKDINDGQSWLDIEKCILPCVVQLLLSNSPFVHAIRAHLLTQMMMGLHCISEDQIKRKDAYQMEYGKQCIKLTEKYNKSFDFPKQHSLYHSTPDIRDKGLHSVYCTRVNEGFHQETREIYARLNKRNMTELDVIKEAMARIRMTLNRYDAEITERITELAERTDMNSADIEETSDAPNDDHWRLGSPQNLVDSRHAMKDALWINNQTRQTFDSDLRSFLQNTFPEEPLREDGEEIITVCLLLCSIFKLVTRRPSQIPPFRCISLHYTSLEDWTDQCDVLRCNPSFQVNHEERFDCMAINMDDDPLTIGRMLFLFQCILPSGRTEDIVLPKTVWQNCRILEDERTLFILPQYFVRGAHLINCFGCNKENTPFI
ncbi:hypothetical protein DFH06DRAFT_1268156 [Mycena polygramma]|nr:hypothetical protein DFH06DRAFT_1268156 [Mycena polygramma]